MPPKDCSTLIRRIHCAMQKGANNELRDAELTFTQFQLLNFLQNQPSGQSSLKELEKHMGVAQSTMVGLVKRSREKGFVECIEDTADRRVKFVRITTEGLNICCAMEQKAHCAEERLLQNLTCEERSILIVLLSKVYAAVSEESAFCAHE